jgi:hypothetical protein
MVTEYHEEESKLAMKKVRMREWLNRKDRESRVH